jgi:hypothetical protein
VTHGWHTRRARWIFNRVLGSRSQQVSFVSVPADGFRVDNWWRTENGVVTIVGENLKLCFYALRYDRVAQVIMIGAGGAIVLLLYRRHRVAARKTREAVGATTTPVAAGG